MPKASSARGIGRLALQARFVAEAGVFGALSYAACTVPDGARHALGTAFGTAWWAADARHRRVALENVRLAYGPALGPRDARCLVRESMRHFARMNLEALAVERFLASGMAARVRVEGLEHLRAAQQRGTGVLAVGGHLGHWELLAVAWARLGAPLAVITRTVDNPYLAGRVLRLRTATGNRVIDKNGGFRKALSILREGGGVGLLIDQRPKRGGIQVPFFGVDAYTTEGLAGLALGSKAAVVPTFLVRSDDGPWRLVIEPEVPVARTGDRQADAVRLTAECTAILERWVRRYPGQYLWTHRRWAPPRDGARPGRRADAGFGR